MHDFPDLNKHMPWRLRWHNVMVPIRRKRTELIVRLALWLLKCVNIKVTGFQEDY